MTKKRTRTADELMAELENDSAYQRALSEQQAHVDSIRKEEAPIIADLEAAGYSIGSIDELPRTYAPLPSSAVRLLLKWLPRVTAPSLQDTIIRSLAYVEEPFDVSGILALFGKPSSEPVRWTIANTIAELRPLDAKDWVIGALAERKYGRAREMLPLALARIAPASVANAVLIAYLDEMPGHVALALAESGGASELPILEKKLSDSKGWVRKELQRAIRAIEKRDNK